MWTYQSTPVQQLIFKGTAGAVYPPIVVDGMHELLVQTGLSVATVDAFFVAIATTQQNSTRNKLDAWLNQVMAQAITTLPIDMHKTLINFTVTNNPVFAANFQQHQKANAQAQAQQQKYNPPFTAPIPPPHTTAKNPYWKSTIPPQTQPAPPPYGTPQNPSFSQRYGFPNPLHAPSPEPKPELKKIPVLLLTRCGCSKEIEIDKIIPEIRVMLMGDVSGFMVDEVAGADIADFDVGIRTFRYEHKRSKRIYSYEDLEEEFNINVTSYSVRHLLDMFHAKGLNATLAADERAIVVETPVYVEIAPERKKKKDVKRGVQTKAKS